MKDKTKIRILCIIIGFIILVMGLLVLIVFLSIKEENATGGKLTQSTRRSISTAEATTTVTNSITTTTQALIDDEEEEKTSTTTSTTTTQKVPTKTTTSTTKKRQSTTTKTSTTIVTTTKANNRHIVTNSTTYPHALDKWEWEIVNRINDERVKNGLNKLAVVDDLRQLAEEAADEWIGLTQDELKRTLYGNSYYAKKSNGLDADTGYVSLYQSVLEKTDITKNEGLKYLGVGVIYKEKGENGIPSQYFIIIYE